MENQNWNKGTYCHSIKKSGFAHLNRIGNHFYIWGNNDVDERRPVAIVLGEDGTAEGAEEAAKLIAAAPEMFDALYKIALLGGEAGHLAVTIINKIEK
jgi:hypothetical protein